MLIVIQLVGHIENVKQNIYIGKFDLPYYDRIHTFIHYNNSNTLLLETTDSVVDNLV